MLVFLPEVFCEVVDEHLPVTTISEPRDALLVDLMVRQKVSKKTFKSDTSKICVPCNKFIILHPTH